MQDATNVVTPSATSKSTNVSRQGENVASKEKIQIVDLHGTNPLVSYKGKTYSCHWASSVGSDLFFAKVDPLSDTKPLRSLKGYELLGLSSAKLTARPAQLLPRDGKETLDQSTISNANTASKRNQTNFLKRLAALRQKGVIFEQSQGTQKDPSSDLYKPANETVTMEEQNTSSSAGAHEDEEMEDIGAQ